MNTHTLLRRGIAGAAIALGAIAAAGGPAAAAGGLVVRPGTSDGPLLPHTTALSTFTVSAPGGQVVIDSAHVTGVDVRPRPGRSCPAASVHAVVDHVHHTTVNLRPAVFTVRLRLAPGAPNGCAGASLVPQVAVWGTDAAGHHLSGTTAPTGSVVGPVSGEAMLASLPTPSGQRGLAVLFALLACTSVLLLNPVRLARRLFARVGSGGVGR